MMWAANTTKEVPAGLQQADQDSGMKTSSGKDALHAHGPKN